MLRGAARIPIMKDTIALVIGLQFRAGGRHLQELIVSRQVDNAPTQAVPQNIIAGFAAERELATWHAPTRTLEELSN